MSVGGLFDAPMAADAVTFGGWDWSGNFTTIDLIAASTNALNGALLARRPDHYKNFTVVGIILMALLGGLGGGMTRDILLVQVPSALTNPAYITLCIGVRSASATCSPTTRECCSGRGCSSS